ncbi:hypothetical protein [Streptomyces sp. CMB-StM0423]|uniref:hypothetical protein n=1 Tax=Streptomyces sp. CMB-StM0423 TaxID=2059884 RepID=UPI000C708D32|nr:hypothetical protein [Streptomyces sp. CMB-StM0423]AUH41898.1 hypothetical protein CXR04_18285 [Streptomyces sp. CMB-StM0423]
MPETFEMIPDPPARTAAFEPHLDGLLELFSPAWAVPDGAGESAYRRCEVKRWEIGRAAGADPDRTRRHAELLVRAAVLDHCRSGINQLVRPLVKTLGHRWTQERIVSYVRSGTPAEKTGATMAWYFSGPPLRYASADGVRSGTPTPESQAASDALADVRAAYREAVLTAFLTCDDPAVRLDLALWIPLDPAAWPDAFRADHDRARSLILADPDHYGLVLRRAGLD